MCRDVGLEPLGDVVERLVDELTATSIREERTPAAAQALAGPAGAGASRAHRRTQPAGATILEKGRDFFRRPAEFKEASNRGGRVTVTPETVRLGIAQRAKG